MQRICAAILALLVVACAPMATFDTSAWTHPRSLDLDETGDQCTNVIPSFSWSAAVDPNEHPFDCRQAGPNVLIFPFTWYRQQVRGLHLKHQDSATGAFVPCPDTRFPAPTRCDVELVRVCRADAVGNMQGVLAPCTGPTGQPTPNMTGPKGCAVCGNPTYTPEKLIN
jgi:hypothetical protein